MDGGCAWLYQHGPGFGVGYPLALIGIGNHPALNVF
jgi:hypothetical protein